MLCSRRREVPTKCDAQWGEKRRQSHWRGKEIVTSCLLQHHALDVGVGSLLVGGHTETGQDWVHWGNPVSKEISSASETGEDWQQGHWHTAPPESHPWRLPKYRDEEVLTAI